MGVVCLLRRSMDEFGPVFAPALFLTQPRWSLYQQGINGEHLVGYQVIFHTTQEPYSRPL